MLTSLKDYCVGTLSAENLSKPDQFGKKLLQCLRKARKFNVIRMYMHYVVAVGAFHVFVNPKHLNGKEIYIYVTFIFCNVAL